MYNTQNFSSNNKQSDYEEIYSDFDNKQNISTFYNLNKKMKPIDVDYGKGKNKKEYSVLKQFEHLGDC